MGRGTPWRRRGGKTPGPQVPDSLSAPFVGPDTDTVGEGVKARRARAREGRRNRTRHADSVGFGSASQEGRVRRQTCRPGLRPFGVRLNSRMQADVRLAADEVFGALCERGVDWRETIKRLSFQEIRDLAAVADVQLSDLEANRVDSVDQAVQVRQYPGRGVSQTLMTSARRPCLRAGSASSASSGSGIGRPFASQPRAPAR